MTADEVISNLRSLASQDNVAGMERFGIVTSQAFGIPTPVVKQCARDIKKTAPDRHGLALDLWKTGVFEARIIAAMIDDPKKVTSKQMDSWARDFDNWATVDSTCCYLYCRTPYAYEKAAEWPERNEEFVKRAGFALMAYLAVHDKAAADEKLAAFLPLIKKHASDERHFVKKAVNWALRQVGKRNQDLNLRAIETAEQIKLQGTKPARWIASDALRELKSENVQRRLLAKIKR